MERVAVIDYGMGNLRSVANALEHVGEGAWEICVTHSAEIVRSAERVVFPGQGAIRDCMGELDRLALRDVILECIGAKPFLGICMGLQALMETSEEDPRTRGLGVYAGTVRRFPDGARDPQTGERLKVPHMGWNQVFPTRPHPLWDDVAPGDRFYFVHSYYVAPAEAELVAARTAYGVEFASALAQGRLFAVQFHPEKSQRPGLSLLRNFLRWKGTF
ncbi:MAG: imidazole glycerol phosphate synthase subunit HisH [Gammaproteobacteria bacterium]|nr:imidazole glycerol phosphate synthase subunit HisH [Gammaproteobacteria bacterium]NIR85824.1 imidazole glycerol phosphate synthase subunit HisH [Gammaproteobacteria bacterium]NIR90578.1 imidazole glycerol phosphate synthase subunit HisH [Gammaproteobacteria bacterium]NIU06959.1 imidazole glycerol phosphate synthase subunit HisH [Gammaproteobacteria bacterium]NIV53889.1 imidazole glycerol phosphate synthase subunit HisH [Gammaproteobacteria bacterium]